MNCVTLKGIAPGLGGGGESTFGRNFMDYKLLSTRKFFSPNTNAVGS